MNVLKSSLMALLATPVLALAANPPVVPPAAPAAAAAERADTVAAQFNRWDTDRNGSLSLDEFRKGYEQSRRNVALAQMRSNFIARDTDKSGYLEKGEYEALPVVKAAGAKAPPFSQADKNADGRLDFTEYESVLAAAAAAAAPPR
jgi:Ca2+-binding EF-hand superfamily protein